VYSIQYYVIKFVSDLRQVGGFLRILSFTNKTSLNQTNYLTYNVMVIDLYVIQWSIYVPV